MEPSPEHTNKTALTRQSLKTLWSLMRGRRIYYLLAFAISTLSASIALFIPQVIRIVLDSISKLPVLNGNSIEGINTLTENAQQTTPKLPLFNHIIEWAIGSVDTLTSHLWVATIIIVLLAVFEAGISWIGNLLNAFVTESIGKRLRDKLYDHLQRLPAFYHQKANPGDLVQRCTSDVDTVKNFLGFQIIELGRSIVMLITATPLLLHINPKLTLVSMCLLPLITGFAATFFNKIRKRFKVADEADGAMTAVLQENITGIRVVRAFARQEFEQEKFDKANDYLMNCWRGLVKYDAIYWSSTVAICISQTILITLIGGRMMLHGQLTIGEFTAFIATINMIIWPIRHMGQLMSELGKVLVSTGRIREILDHPDEDGNLGAFDYHPANQQPSHHPEKASGMIEFQNVEFRYQKDLDPVLHNISFTLHAGETIAIVGPTGSGKSTLIRLLLRLHDDYQGNILLDGTELRNLDRRWIRAQIGVVLQQPFLYSQTLRENIAQGHRTFHASQEMIEQVAGMAAIHDSIMEIEDAYDAQIGERGLTLSGGQRQRVALARALLGSPRILILDDALSAVDTHTEQHILHALEHNRNANSSSHHTTLIITHRLSTLRLADRIMVIEAGCISQLGTHHELINTDGLYRKLWAIQDDLEEDLQEELGLIS